MFKAVRIPPPVFFKLFSFFFAFTTNDSEHSNSPILFCVTFVFCASTVVHNFFFYYPVSTLTQWGLQCVPVCLEVDRSICLFSPVNTCGPPLTWLWLTIVQRKSGPMPQSPFHGTERAFWQCPESRCPLPSDLDTIVAPVPPLFAGAVTGKRS